MCSTSLIILTSENEQQLSHKTVEILSIIFDIGRVFGGIFAGLI
jgi:hypothetical protein